MKFRFLSALTALFLLLATLCGCIMPDAPYEQGTTNDTSDVGSIPQDSSFAVHFIDVGQADAALVICDGKTMLIDGGNVEDSNLIYTYLKKQAVSHLDYVVCTHAHEDHVGGLSGALTAATAGTVFSPVTNYDSKAFRNFAAKAQERAGGLTVPKAGQVFSLGSATVTVVGPIKTYDETNDTSIVLRLVYGETSFLFTGDMEASAEADLLDAGVTLKSTVLKVGHHGSSTSTSYRFLREVAPTYGVISVGVDNQYNHPNDDVLSRLRDADTVLYRTDMQGDIVCMSDGKTVTFYTAKENNLPTNPTEGDKTTSDSAAVTEYAYVGNVNSKIFHLPTCSSLPAEGNRIYFTTRNEAVSGGYNPCGRCKP